MYNTNYMNTKVDRRLSPGEERLLAFKGIPGRVGSGLSNVGSAIINNPGRMAQAFGSGGTTYGGLKLLEHVAGRTGGLSTLALGTGALGLTGLGLAGGIDALTGEDYALGRLIASSSDKERRAAQGVLGAAGLLGGSTKAVQHLMTLGNKAPGGFVGSPRKAALYGLLGLAGAGTFINSMAKGKAISDPSRFDRDNLLGVSDPAQMRGIPNLSGFGFDAASKGSLLEGLIPGIGNANLSKSVTDEMDRRMGKDLGQQASPFMDKLLESVPFTSQRARAAKEDAAQREKAESLYGMFSDMASGVGAKDYKPESKSEPTNFADLVPQYIMDNPGKSALGAGLGSALVYNALGGREGVQEKLEAMRRNPGATAAGLGSLGILSAATYDAMREKKSSISDYMPYLQKKQVIINGENILPFYRRYSVGLGKPGIESQTADIIDLLKADSVRDKLISLNGDDFLPKYEKAMSLLDSNKDSIIDKLKALQNSREKNSNDTNPNTGGPLSILNNLLINNPQNEDGKSDIEVMSQGEGNILASADKGIDTTIDYLPYILGAGALGGAGYGGYKLVDYLRDKKETREKKAEDYELVSNKRKSYLDEIADTIPKTMIGSAATAGLLVGGLPEYMNSGSVLRALAKSIKPAAIGGTVVGVPYGIFHGAKSAYKHNKKLDMLEAAGLIKRSAHGQSHESKFTKEYDKHPAFVGKQKNLPDFLQKKIVDSHSKKAAHGGSPEYKFTQEYNHHSRLQGKQRTALPDFLQKEIIDSRSKSAKFLQGLYS
jgi:hypothetical protein